MILILTARSLFYSSSFHSLSLFLCLLLLLYQKLKKTLPLSPSLSFYFFSLSFSLSLLPLFCSLLKHSPDQTDLHFLVLVHDAVPLHDAPALDVSFNELQGTQLRDLVVHVADNFAAVAFARNVEETLPLVLRGVGLQLHLELSPRSSLPFPRRRRVLLNLEAAGEVESASNVRRLSPFHRLDAHDLRLALSECQLQVGLLRFVHVSVLRGPEVQGVESSSPSSSSSFSSSFSHVNAAQGTLDCLLLVFPVAQAHDGPLSEPVRHIATVAMVSRSAGLVAANEPHERRHGVQVHAQRQGRRVGGGDDLRHQREPLGAHARQVVAQQEHAARHGDDAGRRHDLVRGQRSALPQQQAVRIVVPEPARERSPVDAVPDHAPQAGKVRLVPPGHRQSGGVSRTSVRRDAHAVDVADRRDDGRAAPNYEDILSSGLAEAAESSVESLERREKFEKFEEKREKEGREEGESEEEKRGGEKIRNNKEKEEEEEEQRKLELERGGEDKERGRE